MTERSETAGLGVLLIGYGSPRGPEDLRGFLREVMAGREPSASVVAEYQRRYELIGWSPQMRILESLRTKLEARLARSGRPVPVFLATKHWAPHVADVIPGAIKAGVDHLIAIPLSPYASRWILEPYERAIAQGQERAKRPVSIDLRSGWHLHPSWLEYWVEEIERARRTAPPGAVVILSAHSLPERLRRMGDPYPKLVQATGREIARNARLPRWAFSYQSAGNTTEPWLGPDITEVLLEWKARGTSNTLIAPIGFVFEHLEVLYDLDQVIRTFGDRHGIRYRRIPMPNDDDRLVTALAQVAFPEPAPGIGVAYSSAGGR